MRAHINHKKVSYHGAHYAAQVCRLLRAPSPVYIATIFILPWDSWATNAAEDCTFSVKRSMFTKLKTAAVVILLKGHTVQRVINSLRPSDAYVSKLTIIGSDNGLSPNRRQAVFWTNAGVLLIGPLGTNFSEILIGINIFSFRKKHLKMSSVKRRPFCLGLNVLSVLLKTCTYQLFCQIELWFMLYTATRSYYQMFKFTHGLTCSIILEVSLYVLHCSPLCIFMFQPGSMLSSADILVKTFLLLAATHGLIWHLPVLPLTNVSS